MKVKSRLLLIIGVPLIGMFIVMGVGYQEINRVYRSANYCNINSLPSIDMLDRAMMSFTKIQSMVSLAVLATDNFKREEFAQQMTTQQENMLLALQNYEPMLSDEEDKKLLANDRSAYTDYANLMDQILNASRMHKPQDAQKLLFASVQVADKVGNALLAHRQYNIQLSDQGNNQALDAHNQAVWLFCIVGVVVLVLSFLLGALTSRSIMRLLGGEPVYVLGLMRELARGNLQQVVKLHPKDSHSLASSIAKTLIKLRKVLAEVQGNANNLASAAQELSATALLIAQGHSTLAVSPA